jgi:hypothetical protein
VLLTQALHESHYTFSGRSSPESACRRLEIGTWDVVYHNVPVTGASGVFIPPIAYTFGDKKAPYQTRSTLKLNYEISGKGIRSHSVHVLWYHLGKGVSGLRARKDARYWPVPSGNHLISVVLASSAQAPLDSKPVPMLFISCERVRFHGFLTMQREIPQLHMCISICMYRQNKLNKAVGLLS